MGDIEKSIMGVIRERGHVCKLELHEPKKVAAAIKLLSEGDGPKVVGEKVGISNRTAMRIERDHGKVIEARRRAAAVRAERIAEKLAGRLDEVLEKLDLKDGEVNTRDAKELAQASKFINDIYLRLSGDANVVIEHKSSVTLEDAKRAIAEAREEAMRVKQAGSVEI